MTNLDASFPWTFLLYGRADLIMIFWAIFFVAAERQVPIFKFRNFKQSLENATDSARTVASNLSAKIAPSEDVIFESTMEEEIPGWERASRDQKVTRLG